MRTTLREQAHERLSRWLHIGSSYPDILGKVVGDEWSDSVIARADIAAAVQNASSQITPLANTQKALMLGGAIVNLVSLVEADMLLQELIEISKAADRLPDGPLSYILSEEGPSTQRQLAEFMQVMHAEIVSQLDAVRREQEQPTEPSQYDFRIPGPFEVGQDARVDGRGDPQASLLLGRINAATLAAQDLMGDLDD